MTIRDLRSIHTLYHFHRYIPSSIARLYGVSPKHIITLLSQKQSETVIAEVECQICSNDDAQPYYIDGDRKNNKPQNLIMLCEPDMRKFSHLQLRKRKVQLLAQFETIPQD